jgi:hypothetical protein
LHTGSILGATAVPAAEVGRLLLLSESTLLLKTRLLRA